MGCICAGIMEGDILAAKSRDNEMKNRAKRKRNFPKRKWHETYSGNLCITYHGKTVYINKSQYGSNFGVRCEEKSSWEYKGQPIDNFLSAAYAAFDIADPIEVTR